MNFYEFLVVLTRTASPTSKTNSIVPSISHRLMQWFFVHTYLSQTTMMWERNKGEKKRVIAQLWIMMWIKTCFFTYSDLELMLKIVCPPLRVNNEAAWQFPHNFKENLCILVFLYSAPPNNTICSSNMCLYLCGTVILAERRERHKGKKEYIWKLWRVGR